MSSCRIAAGELRRIVSARPFLLAAAVVCVVPLLYCVLYLWAFWDPYARLDKLPVAVVNLDRSVQSGGTTLHVGDDLVRQLRADKELDWRFVPARQARAGLESGAYYMSLTIPADFSADVASAGGTAPRAATLQLRQNEARNLLASQIGDRAFTELRAALSATTSKGYLATIFAGVAQAKAGMASAGDGASTLSLALRGASGGSSTLTSGLAATAGGTRDLSSGLATLAGGSRSLAGGASRLAGGAGRLAGGLGTAAAGANAVSAGSSGVADGASTLAGGLSTLAGDATRLHGAAATLAGGTSQLHDGLTAAVGQTTSAATSAGQLAGGASQVRQLLAGYIAAHPDAPDLATLETAAGAADQVSAGLGQLDDGLSAGAGQLGRLQTGAAELDTGAAQLASSLSDYSAAVARAHSGAATVAGGAASMAQGAARLRSGVRTTSAGAGALATAARRLASGAGGIAAGAATAHAGGSALVTGIDQLLTGSARLTSGLLTAKAGASHLADGLRGGAASVASYRGRAATVHAATMSDPVRLRTTRVDPVPNYGTGFAPYFIPLALWVGALMTYFIVRPLSGRALASTQPDGSVALAGLWPGVAITALQAVVLVFVLQLALGLHPVEPALLLLFALVSAFAFTAVLQFLSAALGTAGKFVAIVLLMLQLTSSGGAFPLQTNPRFFQLISPWLPMTYVVAGLRQAISGGDLGKLAVDTLVLLGFAAAGICATIATTHRRRTWTMARLKPVVTMQ